jgi:hypothetical protein
MLNIEWRQVATLAGKEFRDRMRNRWVLAGSRLGVCGFFLGDYLFWWCAAGPSGFALD